jgi:glycosyltransferase involved in cell wall biosynthesis
VRCPSIEELPPAPPGRIGWPWTEGSRPLPDRMPDGSEWPKISIVTPNYNYERYLEWTIRSVLLQSYPNLEYIVHDDGSTDGSVELIKRYEKYLAYWASDPNSGQPSVINRGLRRSTGSILAYINSDDYYAPSAFAIAAQAFHDHPEVDFINGRCRYVDQDGNTVGEQFGDITRLSEVLDLWNVWWKKRQFVQPETFWRRRIWEKVGDFRTDLYIVFDWEYWCRMLLAGAVVRRVDAEFACFRFQPSQKTEDAKRVADEELAVVEKWLWDPNIPLEPDKRRVLQGHWLFDCKFRKVADASVIQGQSSLIRWFRLMRIAIRFRALWAVPGFRSRVFGSLKQRISRFNFANRTAQ